MKNLKIRHLFAFKHIVESGSIRAAVEPSNLTQPALTLILQEIEGFFGVSMGTRSQKGFIINSFGKMFYKRVLTILNELELSRLEILEMNTSFFKAVNITAGHFINNAIINQVITQSIARGDDFQFNIQEEQAENQFQMLRTSQTDLIINSTHPDHLHSKEFYFDKLLQTKYIIICNKNHPLLSHFSLELLNQQKWIFPNNYSTAHYTIKDFYAKQGLEMNIATYTNSAFLALSVASKTQMLTLIPFYKSVTHLTDTMNLTMLDIPIKALDVVFYAYYKKPLSIATDIVFQDIKRLCKNFEG